MKFLAGIFVLILAFAAFPAAAMASEVGIEVLERSTGNSYGTDANPVQMCTGPLTVKEVLIRVSNIGPGTDSYVLSLGDMPAGWNGEIQYNSASNALVLASGESRVLDLFVLNNYFTDQ